MKLRRTPGRSLARWGVSIALAISPAFRATLANWGTGEEVFRVVVESPDEHGVAANATDLSLPGELAMKFRTNLDAQFDSSGRAIRAASRTTAPVLIGLLEYSSPLDGGVNDARICDRAPSPNERDSPSSETDNNTAPTITDIPNQDMNWNTRLGPLTFRVGDAETAPAKLAVTASSSNTDLLPDDSIVVSGRGAKRTITLGPGPEQFGSTTVTVTVTDEGGLTASKTFVLTVNGAPMIADLHDATAITGLAVGPLSFTVEDKETPAGKLRVTARSSRTRLVPNDPVHIRLGGNGTDRTIILVPIAGQTGTATITVTVTDAGGLSARATFELVVAPAEGCPADAFPDVRVANDHVTSTNVQLAVFASGGPPRWMAVLVNSEDFDHASWVRFNPVPVVSLGTTDGTYSVWVGIKGSLQESGTWSATTLVVDRVIPQILGVSPADNSVVSTPCPTITGYSAEELESVTYDVYTSVGRQLNQSAVMERSEFNQTTFAFGRTDFQTVGLELEEGTNTVVLHVKDLAGNQQSMTCHYTLDYSVDRTAPALTVTWPANGKLISAREFAVLGIVDDNTASVRAAIVGGGQTREVVGGVSRSGRFQIHDVPMSPGTNTLTVYARDYAGNETHKRLTLQSSTVQVVINPVRITSGNRSVTVTGTVSDASQLVNVNGVAATVKPSGEWSVEVPIIGDEGIAFIVTTSSPTLRGTETAERFGGTDRPPGADANKSKAPRP